MANDTAIKIDGVSKSFKLPHEKSSSIKSVLVGWLKRKRGYEMQHVLKDISLEIKKGEFFGIVGRNGSGKSTLLKLISQIYVPDKGIITVTGKLTPFIELGVGFNPELSGRDNVYLNGALLGFNREEIDNMYDEIVAFAELERFMDQKLKNFSSGMQVRLAFSIAIRAKSDILVLDEVLAVGDTAFQQKCFDYFEELKQTGTTVILVTHDSGVVERFCSRAAIIDNSKLVAIGDADSMIIKYGTIMADRSTGDKDYAPSTHNGTGDVFIYDVHVINKKGKAIRSLQSNEEIIINMKYKVTGKVDDNPVIGLAIVDDAGDVILGPNTSIIENKETPIRLNDSGEITASFASNPLNSGKYTVTVGIFNNKSTFAYEFVKNAAQFNILGKGYNGKIHIEPKWTIN